MEKSTHKVEVFRITAIEKHPNADNLSIIRPFGGYQVIARTGTYEVGDLAAYVPPDSLVPLDREEFTWLGETGRTPKMIPGHGDPDREYHLVRAVKLRKFPSIGLLVPVKDIDGVEEGMDLTQYFEVEHYEPVIKENTSKKTTYGSTSEKAPETQVPFYDLDSLRRYTDVFKAGERVYITEKIHGANARYTAEERGWFSFTRRHGSVGKFTFRFGTREITLGSDGIKTRKVANNVLYMRCGSRNQWKRPSSTDLWWRVLTPEMAKFCDQHRGKVLYGEAYGDVQDLDYGLPQGEARFIAFDIYDSIEGRWLNSNEFLALTHRYSIPTVPVVCINYPFDLDNILALANGPTALWHGDVMTTRRHTREGVVVKPMSERFDPQVGRAALKVVGEDYLERA